MSRQGVLHHFAQGSPSRRARARVRPGDPTGSALTLHYRSLFEKAPDGYLATDRRGKIREANRAAADLVRLPPAQLAGRSLASFVCAEQRPAFSRQLRRLVRRPPEKEEWVVRLEPAGAAPFQAAL
ncbi:MAG TPA: PAS domain-containing protein, partial [Thermoanaerobaculia bacterium]|nr:PAS domain-containing protein [Thermoanaerobaculia bacterium]